MENKFGHCVSLVFTLVLFATAVSVVWQNSNKVARLQSELEQLKAEVKHSSISQLLGQLAVQVDPYDPEEVIPGHQREVRQDDPLLLLRAALQSIVNSQLEAHLNCSTEDDTKCSIEPGPKGDPGPPGPQGGTGTQGVKGERGEKGNHGYPGYKGEEGEKGEVGGQGVPGEIGQRGENGDMGTRGPVGDKGERGESGPEGLKGAKGEKGYLGYPGYMGERGLPGEGGPAGERGGKGDMGVQGPQGEMGVRGETGPVGPAGVTGEKGQLGYPGYKGQKGEGGEGARGEKGDIGPRGPAGEKGEIGPRGEKGDIGLSGETGLSGTPAHPGEIQYPVTFSCGNTSGWTRVVYLDMTNSSHQCPGDLEEVTLSGKRLCGRSADAGFSSCASANILTNGTQYSQVCGRIIGYQYGITGAFYWVNASTLIDSYYVDGIAITHGPPGSRGHVWTFANGWYETRDDQAACPCAPNAPSSSVYADYIPTFIGQDYFCESGNVERPPASHLYPNDPLWDGNGCISAGNTCCQFNNPPWFTKQLSTHTSDDLEVRVCGKDNRNVYYRDTFAELIELYIK